MSPEPTKKRRLWPWLLALLVAPFLLLAAAAVSCLTLDRDAAVLRREMMTATRADWHTTIQLSIGRISLSALRLGLAWVPHMDARARQALEAVHSTSVGVYELRGSAGPKSRTELFAEADRAMGRRGLTRVIGVRDTQATVLIYAPTEMTDEPNLNLCLAVLHGRELVVVSTEVDAAVLAALAADGSLGDRKHGLHLAGL